MRRTAEEPLFNSLMEEHHYLGYEQPVGEHLKYLVWAQGRPIACLAWSSAPRHLGARDRYIGWIAEARRRNIRFIAYNTRFLILPWVRVEHLASHILGRMAARISDDWQRMYGHPIYFLETFVDPERFRGTCYRAANWVLLGKTTGRGKQSNSYVPNRSIKEVLGYPLTKRFRELLGEYDMKSTRRRVDVNLEELDQVLDGARQAPLSEADYDKLKDALHALAAMLVPPRNTEKTSAVLEKPEDSETSDGTQPDTNAPPPPGHGRNGAEEFGGARKVDIAHQKLTHGDRCPDCGKGNVYGQKEPKVLVRIVGQAPLAATVYSLERLRCGACGQVFTAQEPEGVGPEKYDETAAAMIAQLKYGSGMPFYRLEKLEAQLGIPLPAATQWEIVEEAAELIQPARDELIRQAAQGEVLHNDDTSMRVLKLKREPGDERTGVFTSGIVSTGAGPEDRAVLHRPPACGREPRRGAEAAGGGAARPRFRCVTRCRATCRSCPREWRFCWRTAWLMEEDSLWKWRQNFPGECRYVLETLGQVYGHDAEAREP